MYKPFNSVHIGQVFTYNGTWWRKRSSRTAELLDNSYRWFYFGRNEIVVPS